MMAGEKGMQEIVLLLIHKVQISTNLIGRELRSNLRDSGEEYRFTKITLNKDTNVNAKSNEKGLRR